MVTASCPQRATACSPDRRLWSHLSLTLLPRFPQTCDSDTLFHERYFEALTADYQKMLKANHPETHRTIWQAPLFYNWNLDQSSFITRITGLLRTTMTMGCLIPYSVNPMSCFSFSLPLAIRGGYWHPQVRSVESKRRRRLTQRHAIVRSHLCFLCSCADLHG